MGKDGKLTHIEYLEMELGEPDESGRRRPVPKPGTETTIAVDNVIAAIGQFPVTGFLKDNAIPLSRWNTIEVINEATGETTLEGVFAGGDAVSGASIAVEAIGAGRKAARSIHQYITGQPVKAPEPAITKDTELADVTELISVPESKRQHMPELTVDQRKGSFDEVELGFSEEQAKAEAERCLRCGLLCYRREGSV
jgi:formate dehydrogenase beta subunit